MRISEITWPSCDENCECTLCTVKRGLCSCCARRPQFATPPVYSGTNYSNIGLAFSSLDNYPLCQQCFEAGYDHEGACNYCLPTKCTCGGLKLQLPHSTWCGLSYQNEKP